MAEPLGVILAGGRGTRMGGVPKADILLGGQRLLDRVAARLEPQVVALAVNANHPLDTDRPILPDPLPGHPGPLAGVLASILWACEMGARHVVTVAVDTPFFPCDLVPNLLLAAEGHPEGLAIAASSDGLQPAFGLWPVDLRDDLRTALENGTRKVTDWTDTHGAALAHFPDTDPPAFFNINTPADLTRAVAWLT